MKTIAAVLVLVVVPGAQALADKPFSEARRHYEAGTRAYTIGDFAKAIQEYRVAYSIKPAPAILYNLGQVARLSGDVKQAVFFYRQFLLNAPDFAGRRDLERRIRELETQLDKPPGPSPAPETSVAAASPPAAAPAARPPEPAAWKEPVWADEDNETPGERQVRDPVYKKWWLWTVVGVGAAGLAVGLGVGLTMPTAAPPASHFGVTGVF